MINNKIVSFLQERFQTASFGMRFLSSIILAPVALLVLYIGGFTYGLAVLGIALLGLIEWLSITGFEAPHPKLIWTPHCFLALMVLCGLITTPGAGLVLGCVLAGVLFLSLRFIKWTALPWLFLGLFYLGIGALSLIFIRNFSEFGLHLAVYIVLVVWATDIGAYFAGRLIGGAKIWPKISPSKTWAGLGGGALAAAFVSVSMVLFFEGDQVVVSALVGMLLAVIAQVGDFFESFIKRHFGVKDSGSIIPGHGGVLDRIDGLLMASIFFAVVLFCV